MKNPLAALAAALILAAPLAASAQDVPSYAAADAQDQSQDQQIRGRVENFDGGYNLQVRDDQGYVDNVELHDGTIINPTGLTIAPGMVVSILGYNSGSYFSANEVDTPYTFDAGVPFYDGHPWGYYGPSIDLNFFFGSVGWWHGNDFGGGFRYDRGVRIYNDVHVRNDTFRGNGYGGDGYRNQGGYGRGNFGRSYTDGSRQTTYMTQPERRTNVGVESQGSYAPGRSFGTTRPNTPGFSGSFNGGAQRAPVAAPISRGTGEFHGAAGGGFNRGSAGAGFTRGNSGGGSSFHGGASHGSGGGGGHHR